MDEVAAGGTDTGEELAAIPLKPMTFDQVAGGAAKPAKPAKPAKAANPPGDQLVGRMRPTLEAHLDATAFIKNAAPCHPLGPTP
jgi:hypothetical protein